MSKRRQSGNTLSAPCLQRSISNPAFPTFAPPASVDPPETRWNFAAQLPRCHLGVAQNSRPQVLGFGSIYQGAFFVPFLSHSHLGACESAGPPRPGFPDNSHREGEAPLHLDRRALAASKVLTRGLLEAGLMKPQNGTQENGHKD